jgi:hypothetical protein
MTTTKKDKKYLFQTRFYMTIVEGLIMMFDLMIYSFATCGSIMAMALSHKPAFISSLFVKDATSWMEYVAFGLFQFILIMSSCGAIMFVALYLTIYMVTSCHWMRKVTVGIGIGVDKGPVSFFLWSMFSSTTILTLYSIL